jgi:hypothetical protein
LLDQAGRGFSSRTLAQALARRVSSSAEVIVVQQPRHRGVQLVVLK